MLKIYDRHLQANVGQCRNSDEEQSTLALQSSPSQKVWQEACSELLHKERNKQINPGEINELGEN